MSIETAQEMMAALVKEARHSLAIAERAAILLDAMHKTGRAEARHVCGLSYAMSADEPQFSAARLGKQQAEWNLYYACRDYAAHSLLELAK